MTIVGTGAEKLDNEEFMACRGGSAFS